MPNSAGVEVARISVKVSPDTSNFGRELKRDLEKEVAKAERGGASNVHVGADTSNLKSDVSKATDKFKEVTVDIKLKNGAIDKFQRRTAGQLTAVMDKLKATISLDSAGEKFRKDIEKAASEIDKIAKASIPKSVSDAAKRRASGYANDKSKGVSAFLGGASGSFIAALDKIPIPKFGLNADWASITLAITAALALAAPLIGLLSTAILAIPGLIAAVAAPFAAIKLGMQGIKDAATNSGLLKSDGSVGANLEKVKKEVSDAFREGLTPVFTDIKNALPDLLSSMPRIATGLSDIAKGFTDAITSGPGIALFNDTIKNIGNAMSLSAPGVQSFTDGLLKLANSFSLKLPGAVKWFNDTADSFSKWIDQMTAVDPATGTSQMSSAFTGLKDSLKVLGDFVVELGKAGLEFVKDPAKMDGFIQTLRNLAAALNDLVAIGVKLGPAWDFLSGNSSKDPEVKVPGAPKGNYPFSSQVVDPRASKEQQVGQQKIIDTAQEQNKIDKDQATENRGFWSEALYGLRLLAPSFKSVPLGPDGSPIYNQGSVQEKQGALQKSYDNKAEDLKKQMATLQESVFTSLDANGGKITELGQGYVDQLQKINAEYLALQEKAKQDKVLFQPERVAASKSGLEKLMVPEKMPPPPPPPPAAMPPIPPPKPVEMPKVELKAFETSLAEVPKAVSKSGTDAAAEASKIPPQITTAIGDMGGVGSKLGADLSAGFAGGIAGGMPGVQAAARNLASAAKAAAKAELDSHSPSKVFEQIGLDTGKGFEIGLDGGIQPVIDRAKELANKVAEAFASGQDPTLALAGVSDEEVKRLEKVLALETKRMENQAKALDFQAKQSGNDALKKQADDIRQKKSILDEQKSMIDLTQEYNDTTAQGNDNPMAKAAGDLMNVPVDFAKATAGQFMSDIGISGNGFISKAITQGISYIFNVGTVDEAMSAKDRTEKTDAMASMLGR